MLQSSRRESITYIIPRGYNHSLRPSPSTNFSWPAQIEWCMGAEGASRQSSGSLVAEPTRRVSWWRFRADFTQRYPLHHPVLTERRRDHLGASIMLATVSKLGGEVRYDDARSRPNSRESRCRTKLDGNSALMSPSRTIEDDSCKIVWKHSPLRRARRWYHGLATG
jgi:hypothetical protein